jgi:hypothetical protein
MAASGFIVLQCRWRPTTARQDPGSEWDPPRVGGVLGNQQHQGHSLTAARTTVASAAAHA